MTRARNRPSPDQLSDEGHEVLGQQWFAVSSLRPRLGAPYQRNNPQCQRNSVPVGHSYRTDEHFRPAHPGSAVPAALPSQAAVWHPVRSERCTVPDCRPTARCLARRPTFRYAALRAAAAPDVRTRALAAAPRSRPDASRDRPASRSREEHLTSPRTKAIGAMMARIRIGNPTMAPTIQAKLPPEEAEQPADCHGHETTRHTACRQSKCQDRQEQDHDHDHGQRPGHATTIEVSHMEATAPKELLAKRIPRRMDALTPTPPQRMPGAQEVAAARGRPKTSRAVMANRPNSGALNRPPSTPTASLPVRKSSSGESANANSSVNSSPAGT